MFVVIHFYEGFEVYARKLSSALAKQEVATASSVAVACRTVLVVGLFPVD